MQHTNIFIQSSQYIPEQSEPIKFLDFSREPYLDQSNIDTYRKQEKLGRFNQIYKKNPYRLSWANAILHKHYNVDILEKGSKIIIKKLPETEGTSQTLFNHLPVIQKSQKREKDQIFSSISQYAKNNLDKFFKQKRKYHLSTSTENNSYNMHNSSCKQTEMNDAFSLIQVKSQDRLMPIFDVNFKNNLLKYNL
ncbi:unnamed protein product [Paramecium pentaurelia]|uniref:Uncharacterized protein n=1 Tax=Paramecium pentaurelia TaxID=43138 RepID=A0A8S1U9H8_9CILI|nr:unnamed protein product [Paramecium pentaurelia]